MSDPYLYENSQVLRNTLGIKKLVQMAKKSRH